MTPNLRNTSFKPAQEWEHKDLIDNNEIIAQEMKQSYKWDDGLIIRNQKITWEMVVLEVEFHS